MLSLEIGVAGIACLELLSFESAQLNNTCCASRSQVGLSVRTPVASSRSSWTAIRDVSPREHRALRDVACAHRNDIDPLQRQTLTAFV